MAKFRLKINSWTKEEQKVLGTPAKTYVIITGTGNRTSIYRTYKTKMEAMKKLKQFNQLN